MERDWPADFACRTLRYVPNLVRDEWVNIGVLLFDEKTGERRLRMIEEPAEYARVRRLHPQVDESILQRLRDELESRLDDAPKLFQGHGQLDPGGNGRADWLKLLDKCDSLLLRCNSVHKRASKPPTSIGNWNGSTRIRWRRSEEPRVARP